MEACQILANKAAREHALKRLEDVKHDAEGLAMQHEPDVGVRYLIRLRDEINELVPDKLKTRSANYCRDLARNQSPTRTSQIVSATINGEVTVVRKPSYRFRTVNGDVIIPRSQLQPDEEYTVGDQVRTVRIPQWLAAEKDLDYEEDE